jgi:hypothetical protein
MAAPFGRPELLARGLKLFAEKPQGNRKSVDRLAITLTMFKRGMVCGKRSRQAKVRRQAASADWTSKSRSAKRLGGKRVRPG